MDNNKQVIGMFDSGVGGLSVLKSVKELLPSERIVYLADQANVPYGSRDLDEIQDFSRAITEYFIDIGAKLIVVACNTASAAALELLRLEFPNMPFVGMEPAVKPAAEKTETGVVGVLATKATFQGKLYASVVERFAQDVKLIQDPCVGLVEQIEAGNFSGEETEKILKKALIPMLEEGIDTIVLGCTHFPFVFPAIDKIVGPNVRLINPAPAIAKQAFRLLDEGGQLEKSKTAGAIEYLTTGETKNFKSVLGKLGIEESPGKIFWGKELKTF